MKHFDIKGYSNAGGLGPRKRSAGRWSPFAVALSLLGLQGCASLQSVSITEVPRQRDRVVHASEDGIAFLGIRFNNTFADGLRDRLQEQCPHGRVTGIFTKYETFWYVLFHRRQVIATGYCVEPSQGAGRHGAAPEPSVSPGSPAVSPPDPEGRT